jgi:acetoin utilization protein AcuB
MRVSDWMTEKVYTLEVQDTLRTAREFMAKHRINQMPVVANENLVGIVTDRDIRDAYPTSMMIQHGEEIDKFGEAHTVEEVMTFNVITVPPDAPLREAVGLLRRHRIGALPVVKEGEVVGIITRSDVLDFLLSGKSLERPQRPSKQKTKSRRS